MLYVEVFDRLQTEHLYLRHAEVKVLPFLSYSTYMLNAKVSSDIQFSCSDLLYIWRVIEPTRNYCYKLLYEVAYIHHDQQHELVMDLLIIFLQLSHFCLPLMLPIKSLVLMLHVDSYLPQFRCHFPSRPFNFHNNKDRMKKNCILQLTSHSQTFLAWSLKCRQEELENPPHQMTCYSWFNRFFL